MNKIKDIHVILVTNRKQIILYSVLSLVILTGIVLYVNYRPGFLKIKGTPQQLAELKAQMNDGFLKIFAWQDKQDSINKVTKINLQHLPTVFPIKSASVIDITSKYGIRVNPITHDTVWHKGVDIQAPIGTSVFASASGVVTFAGWDFGYGDLMVIDSQNGITTKFGHLSKFFAIKNQQIVQGDKIGAVGTTGNSTGPHLHYEILNNNRNLNPIIFY